MLLVSVDFHIISLCEFEFFKHSLFVSYRVIVRTVKRRFWQCCGNVHCITSESSILVSHPIKA